MEPDSMVDHDHIIPNDGSASIVEGTYAQFVVGTPGAGKSTYCAGMSEFMQVLKRKCIVVNLDPANDHLSYDCAVDIRDLIRLEDVMSMPDDATHDAVALGPNGALLYCMEYLEQNIDWLKDALLPYKGQWILFDCAGQVELYTSHSSMKNIFRTISDEWQWRTACVHLVDIAHCLDAAKFISALLLCLTAIVHLELPHINVLSKVDQLKQLGRLPLGLQFYTEVLDLEHLLELLHNDSRIGRLESLNRAICQLIEEFSMVKFTPLKIENKRSVFNVMQQIDRATGYPSINE